MSDASEVKRWETISIDTKIPGTRPDVDGVPRVTVVSASDFDRIMAERDELWKRATKFVMPGEMDTGESIEHYIETLEQTIAELKAEVANQKANESSWLVAKEIELGAIFVGQMSEMEETTARQARVIEKLKGMVSHYETCATVDRYDDEEVPCDCGLDKELAAIEQGDGT